LPGEVGFINALVKLLQPAVDLRPHLTGQFLRGLLLRPRQVIVALKVDVEARQSLNGGPRE
jgi:hypothetical protein